MTKLKLALGTGIGAIASFLGISAFAATSTVDTIPTQMGSVLDGIVQNIISTVVSFLTNNLPLIVVLSVSIGLVFWLVGKARGATRGR